MTLFKTYIGPKSGTIYIPLKTTDDGRFVKVYIRTKKSGKIMKKWFWSCHHLFKD